MTKPSADVAYLCRALKAPSLARSVSRLAERARTEGWSHEEFLSACLEREVATPASMRSTATRLSRSPWANSP